MSEGFDRIRSPQGRPYLRPGADGVVSETPTDGRESLFSVGGEEVPGCRMGLSLHCSRCQSTTPLDPGVALRAAIPLFLFLPWRDHPIFALCPACDRRSWLSVGAAREQ